MDITLKEYLGATLRHRGQRFTLDDSAPVLAHIVPPPGKVVGDQISRFDLYFSETLPGQAAGAGAAFGLGEVPVGSTDVTWARPLKQLGAGPAISNSEVWAIGPLIDYQGAAITIGDSVEIWEDGQSVAKGSIIGRCGATGYATGYHLHFELIEGEVRRNPLGFLP